MTLCRREICEIEIGKSKIEIRKKRLNTESAEEARREHREEKTRTLKGAGCGTRCEG
jgi:hypothetical protein